MAKRKRHLQRPKVENPDIRSYGIYLKRLKFGLPELDAITEGCKYEKTITTGSAYENSFKPDYITTIPPPPGFKDNNIEDRISKLPDDILKFIISLLVMREGAATSTLSTRWRNLWRTSGSCLNVLNFDDANVNGHDYPDKCLLFRVSEDTKEGRYWRALRIHRKMQHPHFIKEGALRNEFPNFIEGVNRIWWTMSRHRRASPFEALRISYPLGKEHSSHLDSWMKLAAAQGISQLEFDFNVFNFAGLLRDSDSLYRFPIQEFGSSLTYLRLRRCCFSFPPDFHGLSSLISLSLNGVSLTNNNSVQNILSNCPSLEWLSLGNCKFHGTTVLRFVGPSIRLKHLHVRSTGRFIKGVVVHDVNLSSFDMKGEDTYLSIKDLPNLARLGLHMNGRVDILGNFPRLETLFFQRKANLPSDLSVFSSLKRLVYCVVGHISNLYQVVCFIDSCPMLQHLEINIASNERRNIRHLSTQGKEFSMRAGCAHPSLKEVEIYSFDGHPDPVELAKYLLKYAIALEKMTIYTKIKSYCWDGIWMFTHRGCKQVIPIAQVCKLLRKKARVSTQLLIVSSE